MFDEDIPKGTRGTVVVVDDIGTVHTNFDNGRSLDVLPNVDGFRKIDDRDNQMIRESFNPKPTEEKHR